MEAVEHIPLEDREAFKYALAATLVKNNAHWRAFETVFEVYFSLRGQQYDIDGGGRPRRPAAQPMQDQEPAGRGPQGRRRRRWTRSSPRSWPRCSTARSCNGDEAMLRALARQAVHRFAGMEPGRPVGGTYYLYRTLRNLDLDGVLERLMEQAHASEVAGAADAARGAARARRVRASRIDQLRKEIEAEIRRRLVADRGVEAMASTLRKPLPEDVDFMHASREEMATLRKAHLPADPQAGRAPGPQAPPRPQGPARLPQHRAPLAVVRRRAGRAEVPATRARRSPRSSSSPTSPVRSPRSPGSRCMLVYAIQNQFSKVRVVRVHRRHRRGHAVLRGRRGHHRGGAPGQHRGRRRLGRRPLRLRPRLRGVLATLGQGDRARRRR